MELKQHRNPKGIFVGLYILAVAVYIAIGLQPAEATNYQISGRLAIPSISLISDVTKLELDHGNLATPDTIVGSYTQARNKTLLIGHSTTVFEGLDATNLGDVINYGSKNYQIVAKDVFKKSDINMDELLAESEYDTLVIMTCAGQLLDGGDATHRLILTAVEIE